LIAGYSGEVIADTVINFGTITGPQSAAFAGKLVNHGLLVGGTGSTSSGLTGGGSNYGTITGERGVTTDYSNFMNQISGLVIGGTVGVYGRTAVASGRFVTNDGTIISPGTGVSAQGIDLVNGAAVSTLGLIQGDSIGVYVAGAITGGHSPFYNFVFNAGTLTNFGVITGRTGVIAQGFLVGNGYGTHHATAYHVQNIVNNYGTIVGTAGTSVEILTSGSLTLHPGARFIGVVQDAGYFNLASGAGVGTLSGIGTQYVASNMHVLAGAQWALYRLNALGAAISGDGVYTAGTLLNHGTLTTGNGLDIRGTGVLANDGLMSFGGLYIRGTGVLVNKGLMSFGNGNWVINSTLVNAGTTSFINNGNASIVGTVANYGTMSVTGGLSVGAGGVTKNSGTILAAGTGTANVDVTGFAVVVNTGVLQGTANGIKFEMGGVVTNGAGGSTSALISGTSYGIVESSTGASATVTNYATIGGGIGLLGGGTITNKTSGRISGGAWSRDWRRDGRRRQFRHDRLEQHRCEIDRRRQRRQRSGRRDRRTDCGK
jgi:hypothetical protein